jgi:hypothetical protein
MRPGPGRVLALPHHGHRQPGRDHGIAEPGHGPGDIGLRTVAVSASDSDEPIGSDHRSKPENDGTTVTTEPQ